MLPFILREIHNNETTFFNIPGFIRDGFQFRKLVAIYNPNVIILYYGSYVLESNRVFSMPGDIGFVILFTLPMLLTLKDCVRRKK